MLLPGLALAATDPDGESKEPTGTLSGIVIDDTGLGVPSAHLTLDKHNRYTVGDYEGRFRFLDVPVGSYTLTVKYVGYEDYSEQVTIKAGQETKVTVKLKDITYSAGEVVVYGEAAKGQARALSVERNNTNISNVVASDHIGRFPDSNIGDALKRIQGITIQTDQGEARNIVVRGLASQLNSVTLNSGRIPSAEGDNRNIQLDLIPSDMIAGIEVNKTLLPDMEADAIGGSVNLLTKSAPARQLLATNLALGYNPIRKGMTYIGGLTYGNRFLDDKLGVVFSASYHNKDYGSDNLEGEWKKSDEGLDYLGTLEMRKYDVQRVRRSVSLNFDYRINSENNIRLNTMYNWRDDRENRFRYRQRKMEPVLDDAGAVTGYKGEVDRQLKGGVNSPRGRNRRLEIQRVLSLGLEGEHLLASSLEMDWGATYARASEDKPGQRYLTYKSKKHTFSHDYSDPRFPMVKTLEEDPAGYKLDEITEDDGHTQEEEYTGRANFRLPLSIVSDQKGRLRLGGKVRMKRKMRDNIFYEHEYLGDKSDLIFTNIDKVNWDGVYMPGKGYQIGSFQSAPFMGNLPLSDGSKFERTPNPEEYYTSNYNAKEEIYAAYLRWDQNITEDLLFITGLRMEYTHINYLGHTLVDGEKGGDITDTNGYLNWFPNLTFRYTPMDRLVLRGAFSTSIARPNYYSLVPYVMISSADEVVDTGNSHLKSTYAYNGDLMASYYPGGVAQISGGVFYKRLNNFIYKYATQSYTADQFARDYPQLANPIEEGAQWEYSQQRNGKSVDLYGFEIGYNQQLTFLPSFLRNLGVNLNYTFTHSLAQGITNEDGDFRENMPLPGTAPHTVNASLSYEDKVVSLRVSYNYTSDYLDELGGDSYEDRYYGAQSFLDVNANIKLPHNLTIYVEGNNLLNQPLFYYQGQRDHVMQIEFYKPSVTAGLKWTL